MAEIIQGVRFRRIETQSPAIETLRDIGIDLEQAGPEGQFAEVFALVRYPDGRYEIWESGTSNPLTRIGELEAIKNFLLYQPGLIQETPEGGT